MLHRPVLLVDDNPDDVALTRLAFAEAGIANPLLVARDGVAALDYLFARNEHAARDPHALPELVLLDLDLPGLDGRDVMRAVRACETTRTVPVVALTGSAHPEQVDACYALGVNSYIQKPVEFSRFVGAMRQLGLYWLGLNHGPGT